MYKYFILAECSLLNEKQQAILPTMGGWGMSDKINDLNLETSSHFLLYLLIISRSSSQEMYVLSSKKWDASVLFGLRFSRLLCCHVGWLSRKFSRFELIFSHSTGFYFINDWICSTVDSSILFNGNLRTVGNPPLHFSRNTLDVLTLEILQEVPIYRLGQHAKYLWGVAKLYRYDSRNTHASWLDISFWMLAL